MASLVSFRPCTWPGAWDSERLIFYISQNCPFSETACLPIRFDIFVFDDGKVLLQSLSKVLPVFLLGRPF